MMVNAHSRPSLEELKQRCFKQNIDSTLKDRYRKSWAIYYALYVTHFFSIRLVYCLYATPITPNQVSLLGILSGLLSSYFFSREHPAEWLLGAIFFEIYYILDAVDGQLARARGMSSKGGEFLDEWGNFFIPFLIIFSIGMSSSLSAWVSLLSAYAVISLTIIELLKSKMLKGETTAVSDSTSKTSAKASFLKNIYSFFYRSCTMPIVMNAVTVIAVLCLFGVSISGYEGTLFSLLVIYYAVFGTLIWVAKGVQTIRLLSK